MSIRRVVDFWRSVQSDRELQTRLAKLAGEDDEGTAKIASDAGFEVTAKEMREVGLVVDFWDRVERDEALRKQLAPAHEADTLEQAVSEVAKVARSVGVEVERETLEVVTRALVRPGAADSSRLSDRELDAVAGGTSGRQASSASLVRALNSQWQQDIPMVGPGVVGAKP